MYVENEQSQKHKIDTSSTDYMLVCYTVIHNCVTFSYFGSNSLPYHRTAVNLGTYYI